MRETLLPSRTLFLIAIFGVVLTFAPAEAQPPDVMIKVRPTASCTPNDPADPCVFVQASRGAGVCMKQKKDPDNNQVYCETELNWKVTGPMQNREVLIKWSASLSTPGSEFCLDNIVYMLTQGVTTAVGKARTGISACTGKHSWVYDVILFENGQQIGIDDPGVIIDQ